MFTNFLVEEIFQTTFQEEAKLLNFTERRRAFMEELESLVYKPKAVIAVIERLKAIEVIIFDALPGQLFQLFFFCHSKFSKGKEG